MNLLKRRTERNDGDLMAAAAEYLASDEVELARETVMALWQQCRDAGMSRKVADAFVVRMLLTPTEE